MNELNFDLKKSSAKKIMSLHIVPKSKEKISSKRTIFICGNIIG